MMQKYFFILFLMTFCQSVFLSRAALAQECSDDADQNTLNRCANEAWQAADRLMNAAYQSALDMMASIDADLPTDGQGAVAALREGQQAWVTFRDKSCEAEGYMWYGGSAQPMVVAGCLRALTEQRAVGLTDLTG